ncbi:MAG: thioredoxin [Bacteroidales bacterium]|nr:thioredoxin [Bacteroidales bacterium]
MNYYFWIPVGILLVLLIAAFIKRYRMIKNLSDAKDSEKLILLSDASFRKVTGKGVSLVDFWAPWCTPCKIQGPIVSELAEEMGDKANICKLNVDKERKTAASLKIRSIPTIIIFKDGKPVKQFVGVKTKSVLLKALQAMMDT